MLFNSIDFALFLPVVFIAYWFVGHNNLTVRNIILLVASYIFYGWWDWRFLSLILISTLIDYFVGLSLHRETIKLKRKILLWVSISINLGFLGFFKYYNFFLENLNSAFSFLGHDINIDSLSIILPVGISFYTFQTLSYSIDLYRRNLKPTKNFIAFAAFVAFFPQLVAGPIERATNLLPQFYRLDTFDYNQAVDGLKQILWGLVKKIVIADSCAEFANLIFNNSADYSGSTLILGALFFTFQIYGDFSGYSDIAIGTARLFGFKLMKNFAFPYFSRDIAEFWRRWHISLSSWFRDYLYIPLGGSQCATWLKVRNTFIIFAISGFWHGANWTFIIWGLLNAVYFLPLLLTNKNRKNLNIVAQGRLFPTAKESVSMLTTFCLVILAWIFFRAENLSHALSYISSIFSSELFEPPNFKKIDQAWNVLMLTTIFMVVEWVGREKEYAIANIGINWLRPFRWTLYYGLIIIIFIYAGKPQDFIYFQF